LHRALDVNFLRTCRLELSALASTLAALPRRARTAAIDFDADAPHPTPVMLVHGLFGDPRSFHALRGLLARRGVRNFSTFSYSPTIDYQSLAPRLGEAIEALCAATGFDRLDVVGHSLGGLVARYLTETGGGRHIRRLVSLGSPHYLDRFARAELAIFASRDWLVPLPGAKALRSTRVAVVDDCSHLSLLQAPEVFERIAAYLMAPSREVSLSLVPASRAA
jgi:pimeloyl-ACP methyl ester carboxylesterase